MYERKRMKRLYFVLPVLCIVLHGNLHARINKERELNTQALFRAFDNPNVTENTLISFVNACNVDVHARNSKKQTTLMLASRKNYENLTKILIKKNVNVNAQDHKRKTALMHASSNGSLNNVTALVSAGAKVNLKDYHGYTALDYAKRKNLDLDFVKTLAQVSKLQSPSLLDAKYIELMTQKQMQQQGRQNVLQFLVKFKDLEIQD